MKILLNLQKGEEYNYSLRDDRIIEYQGKIYALDVPELKEKILKETHSSTFSMHPYSTKMYWNLKENY